MHDMNRPDAELLVEAYCKGVFPMADDESGEIHWYSPDPRGVIPLDGFHTPRSLARVVRARRFEIRTDTCFERVMELCAEPRANDAGTWIDKSLLDAYTELAATTTQLMIQANRSIEVDSVGPLRVGSASLALSATPSTL